ncbi:MAG: sulfatase-like hydrolase/transferase, partial [Gammaproteobacteria bacterium]|nr:sulfatase-like hydrolase/transferase [Gammaproteobacteria bacterium]
MQKPNILFLITDQQRADHTGFGGNEVLETPNIDSIAARGTVFDAAYVANPICMPNRSTIMTGRMPSVHGTRMNGVSLDQRVNTFVKRLRDAGYRTTHIGKSHLQNMGLGAKALRDMVDFSLDEEAYAAELPTDWNMLENYYTYQSD